MISSFRKTFTLIEMLIVIVIIGILAAALVPRLQAVQARARDARRKTDLKTIYNANEIVKLDKWKYANQGVDRDSIAYTPATWIPDLLTVMTSVPFDPIHNASLYNTGWYSYYYRNLEGTNGITSYALWAKLENQSDPETANFTPYTYAHASSPITGILLYPTYYYTKRRYVYDPMNIRFH